MVEAAFLPCVLSSCFQASPSLHAAAVAACWQHLYCWHPAAVDTGPDTPSSDVLRGYLPDADGGCKFLQLTLSLMVIPGMGSLPSPKPWRSILNVLMQLTGLCCSAALMQRGRESS